MRVLRGKNAQARVQELASRGSVLDAVEKPVARIVSDVRRNGDRALLNYARRLDSLPTGTPIRVSQDEMSRAWDSISPDIRRALEQAAKNIRQFCEWQKPSEWMRSRTGTSLGQLVRPLGAVGCYVPGGRYPLPSTLLMTVIPAQVAGVPNIRVVSPQAQPGTLAAAAMLGVTEFYRIGGAQAVAALAYGTESVPRVDKIVGPGNKYVTAAKKIVAFDCSIDMLAGPTEALIVARNGNPDFIAIDLVSQAEHDPDAVPIFITSGSPEFAKEVVAAVNRRAVGNEIAQQAISENGVALVAGSEDEAMDWANAIAPEHITVSRDNLKRVRNAGSVFIGEYSPQAVGDYASGPNHVLPTAGAARYRGGLSVFDFVKLITVQELSREALTSISSTVISLAEAEGLVAHAEAVRARGARA